MRKKSRAAQGSNPHFISFSKKVLVLQKYDGKCSYCGNNMGEGEFSVDHFVPKVLGGTSDIENLMPSCITCNKTKNKKSIEEFRLTLQLKKLGMFQIVNHVQAKKLIDLGVKFPHEDHIFYFEIVGRK